VKAATRIPSEIEGVEVDRFFIAGWIGTGAPDPHSFLL
jgi:hypothetical protein